MSAAKTPNAKSRVIIEAIDALRNRKARPDETRISHWVERRYGMSKPEILTLIQESVSDGSVLRVKYKDSISYRNPAKFTRFVHSHVNKFSAPLNVTKRILRVLRQLTRTDATLKEGASVAAILSAIHKSNQLLNYNAAHLERILTRAKQTGTVALLPNGNYILAGAKRIIARKPLGLHGKPAALGAAASHANGGESSAAGHAVGVRRPLISADALLRRRVADGASLSMSEAALHKKKKLALPPPAPVAANRRARPMSKRKKFKKSLGPDFLEPSDLGLQYLQDSFEPKCDFCLYTAASNAQGVSEELLVCKDCDAKAHPSCMHYPEDLAFSTIGPWQCIDCKTCAVCDDSGDWDYMLFCDVCDKGYHMNCHNPPITSKPTGKFVCSGCIKLDRKRGKGGKQADEDRADDKASNSTGTTDVGEASSISEEVIATKRHMHVNEKTVLRHLLPHPKDILETYPNMTSNPQEWSVDDVETFVRFIGFPDQATIFKEQEIDGISLLLLKRLDILTGLSLKLGPALKICGHIQRLQTINFD